MAAGTELQSASQGLAVGVALISLFLGLRQWYEHRARRGLSAQDDVFYRRQDVRRWLGVGILAGLAVLVFACSGVRPREAGRGNIVFVWVWLVVLAMIVLTLLVAMWDWLATYRYAREQRRALVEDHLDELRREFRSAAEAARRAREASSDDAPPTDA